MSASIGSPLIAASTVQPSRSGIMTSSVIGGGMELPRQPKPFAAAVGLCHAKAFALEKASHDVARPSASSSMTRISGPSPRPSAGSRMHRRNGR